MTVIPKVSSLSGILLLNKPLGCSSNAALQTVRRLFGKIKAGHTGCLDPLATGMLPICLGEATKFSQYILNQDKTYLATGVLGVITTTGDAEGEILEQHEVPSYSVESLENILAQFRGEIEQIPPMFSALKSAGIPLYKYARKGQTVVREPRRVQIHQLVLQAFNSPDFQILVTCSKGTYIRTLVEDIGKTLGVGAYVSQLHRVSTSGFENDKMYTLDELAHFSVQELMSCVLPMKYTVPSMQPLTLTQTEQDALFKGQGVMFDRKEANDLSSAVVSLWSASDEFLGVGLYEPMGKLVAKRLVKQEKR